ncbi:hypothetical protein PR048_012701 [Dryococelus australis]|uniref:Glucose-methanol-choline oxidoreductase C-terminal domain-containing protein n=1 Tax=Dryococelus australis TaxID=614101 RepID=A0ABQ9HQD0_9NEOP|nr:hypothetical protein PR048_012701 [Dryococelus australis]
MVDGGEVMGVDWVDGGGRVGCGVGKCKVFAVLGEGKWPLYCGSCRNWLGGGGMIVGGMKSVGGGIGGLVMGFCIELSKTEALKKEGIKQVTTKLKECQNHVFDSYEYWECAVRHFTNPENHQVGTCSMGSRMESSVIDSNLRVHGVKNLRVIDASSFPVVPSGNLNAPVIMLAEKGAAIIQQEFNNIKKVNRREQ